MVVKDRRLLLGMMVMGFVSGIWWSGGGIKSRSSVVFGVERVVVGRVGRGTRVRTVEVMSSAGEEGGMMSEAEWKAKLSPEEFRILRQKGTEAPGTGKYDKEYPVSGHFKCAGCGNPLYSAQVRDRDGSWRGEVSGMEIDRGSLLGWFGFSRSLARDVDGQRSISAMKDRLRPRLITRLGCAG